MDASTYALDNSIQLVETSARDGEQVRRAFHAIVNTTNIPLSISPSTRHRGSISEADNSCRDVLHISTSLDTLDDIHAVAESDSIVNYEEQLRTVKKSEGNAG